jgi:hypothetical protein
MTCVTACPSDLYKRSQSYKSIGCTTNKCLLSSSKLYKITRPGGGRTVFISALFYRLILIKKRGDKTKLYVICNCIA